MLGLRGLLRHATEVEHHWFSEIRVGRDLDDLYCTREDPDGDHGGFDPDGDDHDDEVAREPALSLKPRLLDGLIAKAYGSLDDVSAQLRDGLPVTLRWIYLHLVEEYARHDGHADLLRECIDGVTGERSEASCCGHTRT